jgi:UDP-N-acetylmuramoyl-tripeptide--D-alanyl-D-alanine ligase
VGVTGSNGKTTVKEMLALILGRQGPVLVTQGNLNNDIGLPLTLMALGAEHQHGVVEMGANHPGEIARLAHIAVPQVGVITQCAPAHLEGFGSVEGVARAKGELFQGLPENGTAVINADDAHAGLWHELAGSRRRLTFGLDRDADVTGSWTFEGRGYDVRLRTPNGEASLRLPLLGRHNVLNALAAAAAALALGLSLDPVVAGLERMRPVAGRLQPKRGPLGSRIVDDTYNANPGSLAAALSALEGIDGRRWLAFGDMAELGADAAEFHRQAGDMARGAGVERLYALGPLSRLTVDAFGVGGYHFAGHEALTSTIREGLGPDVTILVKGSRSMHMERVVQALEEV